MDGSARDAWRPASRHDVRRTGGWPRRRTLSNWGRIGRATRLRRDRAGTRQWLATSKQQCDPRWGQGPLLSPRCGYPRGEVCRWSHSTQITMCCGRKGLRRLAQGSVKDSIQHCPQLSPVVVHRSDVYLYEVPPVRKPLGAGAHQLAKTATDTVSLNGRTNPLGGRKGHPHRASRRVNRHPQRQRRFANGAAGAKRGKTNASRNTADHADKRARPLSRRDFKTARPPLVFIRLRNPCFLARRRLLG